MMKPRNTVWLEAALAHTRQGRSVIPLRTRTRSYLPWREFRDRIASKKEILNWHVRWPQCLLGVVCGRVSRGLVVVDIDSVALARRLMKTPLIRQTRTVRTPRRGLHLYFYEKKPLHPGGGLGKGWGDLKSERNYVVAPPSPGYRLLCDKKPLLVSDAWSKVLECLECEARQHKRRGGGRLKTKACLVTYNIRHCVGLDGRVSVRRIARVIRRYCPDLVALQEVARISNKGHKTTQAEVLARELKMQFYYYPMLGLRKMQMGLAVLSRHPLRKIRAGRLPRIEVLRDQPRGALWVEVNVNGHLLQIVNTHLSLNEPERSLQAKALLGPGWVRDALMHGKVLLCGDLNAFPSSTVCGRIKRLLTQTRMKSKHGQSLRTWPSDDPRDHIDHIFASPGVQISHVRVPQAGEARIASDHLPLVAKIALTR